MNIEPLAIPGLALIHLAAFADPRGVFAETWDSRKMAALGVKETFVLDAVSVSARRGTVRGLHFQAPPRAQAKLVRVARGRIVDVVVDLRHGSSTFGRHVAVTLAERDWRALLVPAGLAHGFCTLEDHTEVAYKMSDHHAPKEARGLAWDDPDLEISWPVAVEEAILSDNDRQWPRLRDLPVLFRA